jgi:Uncharacterized protein conserved in bacteria
MKLSILTAFIAMTSSAAMAQVQFQDARFYTPMKGTTVTAGYVNIKNTGKKDVEVSLKQVEKFKAVETHETIEVKGQMEMQQVQAYKVPAGQTVELKPGGKHIMLFDPTAEIKDGDKLKAVFIVDKKEQTVDLIAISRIKKASEKGADEHHH